MEFMKNPRAVYLFEPNKNRIRIEYCLRYREF